MIKRIVSFALYQPLFILLGTVLLVGGGVAAFLALPIEAFPDVTDTQVTVITLYPGRAAEEVEKQVTIPLEVVARRASRTRCACSRTPSSGCRSSSSPSTTRPTPTSRASRSSSGCARSTFPQGVQPELAPLSTPIGEVYRYTLKSDTADSRELRTLQDWVVSAQLKLIPGVADVVSFGGLIKQYEVNPDLREAARSQGDAAAAFRRAQARQRERRRQLHRAGRTSSTSFAASACCAPPTTSATSSSRSARRAGARQACRRRRHRQCTAAGHRRSGRRRRRHDGIVLMRKGENPSVVLSR